MIYVSFVGEFGSFLGGEIMGDGSVFGAYFEAYEVMISSCLTLSSICSFRV